MRRIPIVAGAAGDRRVRPGDPAAIRESARKQLIRLGEQYPHSEIVLLTGLSAETDLLCAEAAVELEFPVIAALDAAGEEKQRTRDGQERIDCVLRAAEQVFAAPRRDYVQHNSQILLSFDGNPESEGESLLRAEIPDTSAPEKIDEFNRLLRETPHSKGGRILKDAAGNDPVLEHMKRVYHGASGLSHNYAGTYRKLLGMLAAAGTILTLAFLLYDEAQLIWMILICGGMIAAAWFFHRSAVRSDCHRRYIEYRVLAEWLRVQAHLRYAGSGIAAEELLTWTQRQETSWIVSALKAMNLGPVPSEEHDIRKCWVDNQKEYHRGAAGKSSISLRNSEGIVRTALILSIILYADALILELLFGGLIFNPAFAVQNLEMWRVVLKIALGSLSAATLFIANYFGKQSLPRVFSDHGKMEKFYSWISEEISRKGQTPELLELLAREELIENGNWVSYQRDNTPDISL